MKAWTADLGSRLALFGSVLDGRSRPESDVDLLVEFEPTHEPGLLGLASMEAELTALVRVRHAESTHTWILRRRLRHRVEHGGFKRLGELTRIPAKSLMRVLGPKGNPQARNLFDVIAHLQRAEGVRFQVSLKNRSKGRAA